jgi:hypothetical protein
MSPQETRRRRRHTAMTIKIPPFKLVPQPLSQEAADQPKFKGPAGTRPVERLVRVTSWAGAPIFCRAPKPRSARTAKSR